MIKKAPPTASHSSEPVLHLTPTLGRLDLVRLHDPHAPEHIVQFYEHDAFLVDNICFVSAKALAAESSVLHIATQEHRAAIECRLADLGIDIENIAQGRYASLDAAAILSSCMGEDLPDESQFDQVVGEQVRKAAEASENGFVFLFGEMVGLLCAANRPGAALWLEELWNTLSKKHCFSLYCGYPLQIFERGQNAGALYEICAKHSFTIPAES